MTTFIYEYHAWLFSGKLIFLLKIVKKKKLIAYNRRIVYVVREYIFLRKLLNALSFYHT